MKNYYINVRTSCPTEENGVSGFMIKTPRLFCFSKWAFF